MLKTTSLALIIISILFFCSCNIFAEVNSEIEIKQSIQIEDLKSRIEQLEKNNKSDNKISNELYDTLVAQKDIIYERILDDLKANSEEANSKINYLIGFFTIITAIFALVGTVVGIWGFTVKNKMKKTKKEIENASLEINQKTIDIDEKLKLIKQAEDEIQQTLAHAQDEYNEVSRASEQAAHKLDEITAYRDAIEDFSSLKEKVEKESEQTYNFVKRLSEISAANEGALQAKEILAAIKEMQSSLTIEKKDDNLAVIESGILQEQKIKKHLEDIKLDDEIHKGGNT